MLVAVVTLAVATVLAWLSWEVDDRANQGLLDREVEQIGSLVGNSVALIQVQLADAAYVATATEARPGPFQRFAAARITANSTFVSLSLLRVGDDSAELLTTEGEEPLLPEGGLDSGFFSALLPDGQLTVAGILPGEPDRLGYALRSQTAPELVVYAEQALEADRQTDVPEDSPFGGLDLAIYLGDSADPDQLLLATAPTPIAGDTASTTLPFGDTTITVVGAARTQLTGTLSTAAPWIVIGVGIALAAASAAFVEALGRRRALAEQLAADNERLYHQQRGIASTLQHAMLPVVPTVDGIEVAARYAAGTDELDVGGDWYDLIPRGPGSCVFVVGDISGHGLPAATTMAALRFAVRAYLAQGDDIETVMVKLRNLLHVETDHQFATVLIGELDVAAGRLRVVSAGHLPPLLVSDGGTTPVACRVAPPVGVDPTGPIAACQTSLPRSGMLLAFTDGLVERRGEPLDAGLERLERAAVAADGQPMDSMVAGLMGQLVGPEVQDDTVLMGLRWTSSRDGDGRT